MTGDCHVPFRGSPGVRFPRATRLSSGTYFPPPVKAVAIPKTGGGIRVLGVPTVSDRIAQTVGWILMLVGAAWLAIFLYWNRRRAPRTVMTERRGYDDTRRPPV